MFQIFLSQDAKTFNGKNERQILQKVMLTRVFQFSIEHLKQMYFLIFQKYERSFDNKKIKAFIIPISNHLLQAL